MLVAHARQRDLLCFELASSCTCTKAEAIDEFAVKGGVTKIDKAGADVACEARLRCTAAAPTAVSDRGTRSRDAIDR